MARAQTFDPLRYKQEQREQWRTTAQGWRRWCEVIEGPELGQVASGKLLELAGVGPGDAVLDVAGGYGEPALTAARAVGPTGRVFCTDISAEMLAHGRERAGAAGVGNIEFLESDAEELDFPPATFDAVLSRWGLMFLPDLPGTLRRLHGFLKPHGRLAAITWGPPPSVQFAAAVPVILSELELPPPPTDGPGMFALADPETLAGAVAEAGFRDVETGPLDVVLELDSPETFTAFMRDVSGPIAALAEGRPPDVQRRVWDAVTENWRRFATPEGSIRTVNRALFVAGTK